MAITVTGGKVLKGRNVTAKDKKGKTVATFDKKGKKSSSSKSSSSKSSSSKSTPSSSGSSTNNPFAQAPLPNTTSASGEAVFSPAPSASSGQVPIPVTSVPPNVISEASNKSKFFSTNVGKAVSGFSEGVGLTSDPLNRDPQTQDVATQIGFAVGSVASIAAVGNSLAAFTKGTAVSNTAKVGQAFIPDAAKGTAGLIAKNSVTAAKTSSWLSKFVSTLTNPSAVIGTLMATIGSYPFAGFIKEEALQTASFGVKSALDNGDFEGAEAAIDHQREMLNPSLWDQIIAGVPYVNVVAQLKDFYESANIKLAIDEQVVADTKGQLESDTSNDDFYSGLADKRQAEKDAQRESDAEYYAEVERQRKAAKTADRAADEAYWSNILKDKDKEIKKKDDFGDDYWTEYYKTLARVKANSAPSNLKFGLL